MGDLDAIAKLRDELVFYRESANATDLENKRDTF